MLVQTRRYGPMETVDVPTARLYEFYPGLGGFEGHHRFAVISDTESPVEWLQSTADPDVVFAMLDPFLFEPGYSFEMADPDAAALGLRSPEEAIIRVILTLRESAAAITANLMAPIVLNPLTRLGRQVVLQDSDLPLRFPVLDGLQAYHTEAPATAVANAVDEASADATAVPGAQAA